MLNLQRLLQRRQEFLAAAAAEGADLPHKHTGTHTSGDSGGGGGMSRSGGGNKPHPSLDQVKNSHLAHSDAGDKREPEAAGRREPEGGGGGLSRSESEVLSDPATSPLPLTPRSPLTPSATLVTNAANSKTQVFLSLSLSLSSSLSLSLLSSLLHSLPLALSLVFSLSFSLSLPLSRCRKAQSSPVSV
jgi:hypothetical protein